MEQAKQYRDYVKGDKVTVIKVDKDFTWYVSQFDMYPHKMFTDIFHRNHELIKEEVENDI